MSTRGWIGKYCPNCCSKNGRYLERAVEKNEKGEWIYDNVKMDCPDCKWEGKWIELVDSEEEFKNKKRTKLIEKMLK